MSYEKLVFQCKNLIIPNLIEINDYFLPYSRELINSTGKDPLSSTTSSHSAPKNVQKDDTIHISSTSTKLH